MRLALLLLSLLLASPAAFATTTTTPSCQPGYTWNPQTQQCALAHSTVPPGMDQAWSTSTMSVQGTSVTKAIFLSNATGLQVASIASNRSISSIVYNATAIQFDYPTNGTTALSFSASQAPSKVYADAHPVPMCVASSTGCWSYANGKISMSIDPLSISVFWPSSASAPSGVFVILLVAIVAVAAIFILRRRR